MKREIEAVAHFLKGLIAGRNKVPIEKLELFVQRLAVILEEKFQGHWYPDNPLKGNAFRCIRVNLVYTGDPEILQACKESGVEYSDLGLPLELTLWIDPGAVCGRFGEQSSDFPVASFCSDNDEEDDDDDSEGYLEDRTSDYDSVSSSDDECTCHLIVPNSQNSYQVLNPCAPAWFPRAKLNSPNSANTPPHLATVSTIPRRTIWVPRYPHWNRNFVYSVQ